MSPARTAVKPRPRPAAASPAKKRVTAPAASVAGTDVVPAVLVGEVLPAADATQLQWDQLWLQGARLEVLQCRELRHAWPRQHAGVVKRRRRGGAAPAAALPMSEDGIEWKVLQKGPPTILERTMTCTAGCKVRRVETFVIRAGTGRLVRSGKPKMRYPRDYKRERPADDAPALERLDPDVLRGGIIARLVPGLKW